MDEGLIGGRILLVWTSELSCSDPEDRNSTKRSKGFKINKKNFSGKKKNKPTPSSFQRGDKWERKDRKKQIRKGSWPVECWGKSAAAGSRGYSTDEDRQMIDEELGNAAVIFVNFQAY